MVRVVRLTVNILNSAMNSSTNSLNETKEEKRLKAENSLLVNRLRDLTDEIRDVKRIREYSFS